MDAVNKEKRSWIMSRIRSRDTGPELALRELLRGSHLRYQPRGIAGRPDFAHKRRRVAVFLDGCFWHGCPEHFRVPKSNIRFWAKKIWDNRARDTRVTETLIATGWQVVRIWEHELKGNGMRERICKRLHA